jgi:hypothetical protein
VRAFPRLPRLGLGRGLQCLNPQESREGLENWLTDITGPRYRKAGRAKKSAILDEFCQTTGYNRKYAITLLRHAGKTQLRRMGKGW